MRYVKELKRYSKEEMYINIGLVDKTINELKEKNILKKEKKKFYFKFVGLIKINEFLIFSIPKYINQTENKEMIQQILKLFTIYSINENLNEDELESFGQENKENNFIALMIFIIKYYLENGLYINEHKVNRVNGSDEINWNKTIEDIEPIFIKGNPLYLDFYTSEIEEEKDNYFKNLNKYILNKCIKKLKGYGILEALGFEYIEFEIDEILLDFEDYFKVQKKILDELNDQFVTLKQDILKAMLAFIKEECKINKDSSLVFYGTRSFHVVWEKVCSFVLGNKFNELKHIIDKPIWEAASGDKYEARTLIPDIICETNDYFVILDAKYYSIELTDNKLVGQPGVEDITKQYLYQLAFKEYVGNKKFKNILLFPSENSELIKIGKVSIGFLNKNGLEDIQLFYVSAKTIYQLYCQRKIVGINKLILCNLKE